MIAAPPQALRAAAKALAETGRARIDGFLDDDAALDLLKAMGGADMAWMRAIHNPHRSDIPLAEFERQPVEEQHRLFGLAYGEATDGFQYIYDRVRLGRAAAGASAAPEALIELYRAFNAPAYLDFARELTGDDRIAYVDAQTTRYLPGHFLNGHDDRHDANGRLYAYVLNLCPRWRPEWGGLLTFMDGEGAGGERVTETFVPGWNTLNLFRVPQAHAVTFVAPFAGAPRLSITGWWRATPPG